jgi:hypothetical protein
MHISKKIALFLALVMVLAAVGPVAAQDGDTGDDTGDDGSPSFHHPIVILLASYFGVEPDEIAGYHGITDDADDDTGDDTGDDVDGDVDDVDDDGDDEAEGLGFGTLVKLYAIAAESQEACAAGAEESEEGENSEPCEPVTVEELIAALESGMEMGDLFEEYGRPSILGVGHVKKGSGPPDHAGPKDNDGDDEEGDDLDADLDTMEEDEDGPPSHAGRPDHAGPKDKDKGHGRPDHAGPKDK